MSHSKAVLLRDLMIFQVKLVLDGMKDIVLMPLTIGAAAIDIVFPGAVPGQRFYTLMSLGERFDRWLNLFSAADHADASRDGLFRNGRTGERSLISEIEDLVTGSRRPQAGTEGQRPV